MNRPNMTPSFSPVPTYKPSLGERLGSGVSSLIRFAVILGVVGVVGYFALDTMGVFDLGKGQTVQNIQDRNADLETVRGMLRGN